MEGLLSTGPTPSSFIAISSKPGNSLVRLGTPTPNFHNLYGEYFVAVSGYFIVLPLLRQYTSSMGAKLIKFTKTPKVHPYFVKPFRLSLPGSRACSLAAERPD